MLCFTLHDDDDDCIEYDDDGGDCDGDDDGNPSQDG